uniref:Uncharacterized protein n=1 Tax=viral metagenome TaxID=1070528 RepID=A0A6M3LS33_9ZZZZ
MSFNPEHYNKTTDRIKDLILEIDSQIIQEKIKMGHIEQIIERKEGQKDKLAEALQRIVDVGNIILSPDANPKSDFPPYEEARNIMRSYGLKSSFDFAKLCDSGERPANIPSSPYKTYKTDWERLGGGAKAWRDFLCVEDNESLEETLKKIEEDRKKPYEIGK